jgi:multidrug efflux pump subunit AcrA (membrane-fusion protein)
VARSFLRAALESKSSDAAEAKTLAGQLLARIDSDEQAERQKIVDDRLARERAVREQEQMRLAELERRERQRIDREKQLAAEREAARLAQEKEDRERPLREVEERAYEARAQAQQRQQCDAVVRVCKGRMRPAKSS